VATEIDIAWFVHSEAVARLMESQLKESAGLALARGTPESVADFISELFDKKGDASDDYDEEREEGDEIEGGHIRELAGEDHRGDSTQDCHCDGAQDCN
jgi:hypothetical protein